MSIVKIFKVFGTDIDVLLYDCSICCPAYQNDVEWGERCSLSCDKEYELLDGELFPVFCKLPEYK